MNQTNRLPKKPHGLLRPLALTMLILSGLTLGLARFDEKLVIRITKPVTTEDLVAAPGSTIAVEGIADDQGAVYQKLDDPFVSS